MSLPAPTLLQRFIGESSQVRKLNLTEEIAKDTRIEQMNVQNCSILAALYGLSIHPNREALLKEIDVVEITKPNGKVQYKVSFPKTGKQVTVPQSKLGQTRDGVIPVQGNPIVQLLEYAASKRLQPSFRLNPFKKRPNPLKNLHWKHGYEILNLFGSKAHQTNLIISPNDGPLATHPEINAILDRCADEQNEYLLTAGSMPKAQLVRVHYRTEAGISIQKILTIYPYHTYTIAGIDKASRTIKLCHPFDMQHYRLTYKEFAVLFGTIRQFKLAGETPSSAELPG